MPESYATQEATSFEVVSAYAASRQTIPSYIEDPSWQVIGAFFLPLTGDARVDALGSVSENGLTLKVRLFDLTTLLPVPGEVVIVSTSPTRALGPVVGLTGGRSYQIQAMCTGGNSTSKFATLDTVSLSE